MDDFAAKLQGILSSPEGQEQLRGIAGMLGMNGSPAASAPSTSGQASGNGSGGLDFSGLLNALGGMNGAVNTAEAPAPPPSPAGQPGVSSSGGLDLSALMSMLGGANGGAASATPPAGSGAGGASGLGGMDLSGLMSMFGGANGLASSAQQPGGLLPGMPNIDINMILKMQKIFSSMNVNDKNSQLLVALKPHFGERRQAKVDQAIGLMRIFSALPALRESGILSGLTGLPGLSGLIGG